MQNFNRIYYYSIFLLFGIALLQSSLICLAQVKDEESLLDEIETVKDVYRKIGLGNLDIIEGIYEFKIDSRDFGFQGDLSTFNTPRISISYAAIIRSKIDNVFYIYWYTELFGNKFLLENTNWIIQKVNSFYLYKREEQSEIPFCCESRVEINGTNISFIKESPSQGSGVFHSEFTSIRKIYPNSLENNIFKTGTGFFISSDGYLLTNYHVIENGSNIYISNNVIKRTKAHIIAFDEEKDIAILRADCTINPIPYKIIHKEQDIGSNVFTLGYPLVQSMGQDVKLTNGIINSRTGFQNDQKFYQFSAEIQAGNSGGPLFNYNGDVIGLVSAKHTQATNVGYALKGVDLYVFISIMEPSALPPENSSLKSLSLSSMYKIIKDYILFIEVE